MPWIIILIVVISIISKASKKKKAEEAAKKAAQQAMAMEQNAAPRPVPQGRSARFPDEFAPAPAKPKPQPRQMMMDDLPKRKEPTPVEQEIRRRAEQQKKQQARTAPIDTTLTHVVKPVTESRHAHTESSMGGGESCPPKEAPVMPLAVHMSTEPKVDLPKLGFSREEVVRGLLYAEILGKPKALRK